MRSLLRLVEKENVVVVMKRRGGMNDWFDDLVCWCCW